MQALRHALHRCAIYQNKVITLKGMCFITCSYFIQDGFVKFVDCLFQLLSTSTPPQTVQDSNEITWRFLDAILILILGYLCFLGLETGNLNLIRWPTLTLFIYRVVEYCVEHLYRLTKSIKEKQRKVIYVQAVGNPSHLEWTAHFLIPAINLAAITLYLWRFVSLESRRGLKHAVIRMQRNARRGIRSGQIVTYGNDEIQLLDVHENDEEEEEEED